MIHPIIDEYYQPSPSYTRSSKFARDKGLVMNAPGAVQASTPRAANGRSPARGLGEVETVRRQLEDMQRVVAAG